MRYNIVFSKMHNIPFNLPSSILQVHTFKFQTINKIIEFPVCHVLKASYNMVKPRKASTFSPQAIRAAVATDIAYYIALPYSQPKTDDLSMTATSWRLPLFRARLQKPSLQGPLCSCADSSRDWKCNKVL